MTEIDFEELDRAVNSIMSRGTKPNTSRPNPTASARPAQPASPPVPARAGVDTSGAQVDQNSDGVVDVVRPTVEPRVVTQPQPAQVPAAPMPEERQTVSAKQEEKPVEDAESARAQNVDIPARRGGRFMDVVHPGVSMRGSGGATSRTVSRNAATIQPSTEPQENDAAKEIESLLSNVANEQTDTSDSVEVTQKTPIDMSEVQSPFLADTKVPKRPLGKAAWSRQPEEKPADTVEEEQANKPVQSTPPVEMPAELTPDLLTIESDTTTLAVESTSHQVTVPVEPHAEEKNTDITDTDSVSSADSEPTVESDSESQAVVVTSETPQVDSEQTTSDTQPRETASAAMQPVGAIAIQQQYQSTPSSTPEETGSIYDTDSYHQPLVHPEKKKSGWLWIVWVVLLLGFGAGGGAVAYFVLLQ